MNRVTHHRGESHLETVDSSQTKVGQFDLSTAGDQDVLWLQVTVDHTVGVQEVEPLEKLVHHILEEARKQVEHCYHGDQNNRGKKYICNRKNTEQMVLNDLEKFKQTS